MMFLRKTTTVIITSTCIAAAQSPSTCFTTSLASQPPTAATGLALKSFTRCSNGSFSVTVYIENIDYNKVVTLGYASSASTNALLSFGYDAFVAGTNKAWETWSGTAAGSAYTRLSALTYTATNIGRTFVQHVDRLMPYAAPLGLSDDITSWLDTGSLGNDSQSQLSARLLFNNINIPGTANGTVIAAQSYVNPNYAYNWVRDASLVMDVVQQMHNASSVQDRRTSYDEILFGYASARYQEQNDPNLATGLGEPKFNLNNTIFTGPWGRPQNDGPATSALTLIGFSKSYLAAAGTDQTEQQRRTDLVRNLIYGDGRPNSTLTGPVLRDLLFVASNWSSPSFDIWEEVESAAHFYNRMVSSRAMKEGSVFASDVMGDTQSSQTLSSAASTIGATLSSFWNATHSQIDYEIGDVLRGKSSFTDIAVILGLLHGYVSPSEDGVFSYTDERVLAIIYKVATSFLPVYAIANTTSSTDGSILGIPIGRYPEDTYNGTATANTAGGNPWFLSTFAIAEILYNIVADLNTTNTLITTTPVSIPFWSFFAPTANLVVNTRVSNSDASLMTAMQSLLGWADAQMRRGKFHIAADGHIAEEFDRTSGVQVGAKDLSWSYAALLTAGVARARVLGDEGWLERLANSDIGA